MDKAYKTEIMLDLALEVASKVNHDILGSMHVVNFCSEEMNTESLRHDAVRFQDYGQKLRHSTYQMSETIRLSRLVVNSLKVSNSNNHELLLSDALHFSAALAQIFQRHLNSLSLEIGTGKKLRGLNVKIEQCLVFSMIFSWIAAQRSVASEEGTISIRFDENHDSKVIEFSLPHGQLSINSLRTDLIPGHHPLLKYLESFGKLAFLQRLSLDRDIIGFLKERDGRDHFYLHIDLFQREFDAVLA